MKKIVLTRGFVALVDDEDYERAAQYPWFACPRRYTCYARSRLRSSGPMVYLHRFVLQAEQGEQVDHISGDGLDCRRANMRLTDDTGNRINTVYATGTSGYRGVTAMPCGWQAKVTLRNKSIYLGVYRTPEDAARAYDVGARLHHGEFAITNFED